MLYRALFALILSLLMGGGGLAAIAAQPATPEPAAAAPTGVVPAGEPSGAEWVTYGGNLYNQRYSSLDQITTDNVKDLKGAWTFHTGTAAAPASFETSPIVLDGVMYITGPHSQVWALDAKTGKQIWFYDPKVPNPIALPICCGQDNRGVDVGLGRVFVATLDGRLIGLDAKTGAEQWVAVVADPGIGESETMAPRFYDGKVFIGVSGAEYTMRGRLTAYDATNGAEVWRFNTIPGPGEPGHDTWPQDSNIWESGGASVWSTPAVDPEMGLLYFVIANPNPDLDGSVRAGDNLYASSIVALDITTGQLRWYFQTIHHDIWDYDAVSPVVLFDIQMNGQMVKALGHAGRNGLLFLLNREDGTPLVGINEQPVPQMEAQRTSETQPIPVGDSFVPITCPEVGGSPLYTPFGTTPVLVCPGANGGSQWSPMPFSPQTNLLYVCGVSEPWQYRQEAELATPAAGEYRLGSVFTEPTGITGTGTFTAMDPTTNKIVWQHKWDQTCVGGSTTTAGNLVFTGESNGNFDAYNAKTGDLLWQFKTGAGVNAPDVTYEIDGVQYVAVASGGNELAGSPRGDTLWAFTLDGTMDPVAAPSLATPAASAPEGAATPAAAAPDATAPAAAPAATPAPAAAEGAMTVEMYDIGFHPNDFTIPANTDAKVTLHNIGKLNHNFSIDDLHISVNVNPGETKEVTINAPAGTYTYYCNVDGHRQAGMVGTLTVK
ncbi:MAG: PQQ-dependent dehydrogenase, methanol/ethanol family [Thermomicrobiales bacterium]|nr:PQQ-dependent dehydrogenase, methanol/ethanol family [Thermomicrobiales bacterium]